MKSMCRRRPTSAALAIAVAVAHQASCGVDAFVAPGAGIATLPPSFSSRLLASVEDATVTDSNAAPTEENQEPTSAGISENPRKAGLALMLDDGTRKSHSMAENTAFVSGFFKGIATQSAFANLVTSLYFVYQAMENEFENSSDASVKALDYSELRRVNTLEKDMEFFYGPEWASIIAPSAAAKRYVARIQEIGKSEPELLIAHQYTRYLGDLFGGQMMGGMASKSLGLEPGQGTSFYQFDDITDAKAFIDEWYTNLNELDLTSKQKEAIVDEANLVFALNIEILEELEGSPFKAMLMLAISAFKEKIGFQ